jgi:hypothetical protein
MTEKDLIANIEGARAIPQARSEPGERGDDPWLS